MATNFGFLYTGCTLAPAEEYDWTIHVRRRWGLMSNYFDHLFEYIRLFLLLAGIGRMQHRSDTRILQWNSSSISSIGRSDCHQQLRRRETTVIDDNATCKQLPHSLNATSTPCSLTYQALPLLESCHVLYCMQPACTAAQHIADDSNNGQKLPRTMLIEYKVA